MATWHCYRYPRHWEQLIILTQEGISLRTNRSHSKPWSYHIPVLNGNFHCKVITPFQSEINDSEKYSLSGPQHPPKEKYSSTFHTKCSFSLPVHPLKMISTCDNNCLSGPQHPHKEKYFLFRIYDKAYWRYYL